MDDAPAYSESLFAHLNLGWAPLHSWRTARFKYIDAPGPELYDLAADPAESINAFSVQRVAADSLALPLRAVLAAKAPQARIAADSNAAERLRGLGYVSGSPPTHVSGRDPKDAIALLRQLERGLAEARANPSAAIASFDAVLHEEPEMPLALRYRAIALQQARRFDEAVADLRAIEALGPSSVEDLVLEAETQRLAGRNEKALEALDSAVKAQPEAPEPLLIRGRVLKGIGRLGEAQAAFEAVLRIVPGHVEAVRGLADLAFDTGRTAGAAAYYERILGTDDGDVGALARLGVIRVRDGRVAEGLSLFEKAVEREPGNAETLLYLAGALAKSGQAARAVTYFERALAAGGPTTVALNGLGFARLESGDAAGALATLGQSLKLEPRQPQVAAIVAQLRGRR